MSTKKIIEDEVTTAEEFTDAVSENEEVTTESAAEVVTETKDPAPVKEAPKAQPKKNTGTFVNSKFVRVRKAPSTTAGVALVVAEGSPATILGSSDAYYKVAVKTTDKVIEGYVSKDFFKED
jgi:hypothetical protein